MAVTKTIILYSGTSFRVPNTWNSLNNSVICIGAGGGGRTAGNTSGGGGGAYASNVNITLTPNSTISIIIGAGGAANANGGFTSINSGTVNAAGGKSNTSGGGAGGSTSDSTGTTTFAGGRGGLGTLLGNGGGGGGGGAGGNTATGNTGNASTGASDVATRGGNAGRTGGSQFNGWDRGDSSITFGNGYGGGGGEGGYVESGKLGDYISGSPGYLFGGGGGGGADPLHATVGGVGGQGGIILSWTYNSKLPDATVAMTMDAVTIALDRTPSSQITLNEGDVRDLFQRTTAASLISFANGASKVANGAIVATSNTTGTGSTISLPSGWQNGDLAVLFILSAAGGSSPSNSPIVTSTGWSFLGANSRSVNAGLGYTTCAFGRVLQTGDLAPEFTQSSGGAYMIAIRNASLSTAIQANNSQTGTTLNFSGFTKNADSKKLLTFITDRDLSNATAPTGWTEHSRAALSYFSIECASINSASYTNGTTVSWTGFTSGGSGQQGILLEVS